MPGSDMTNQPKRPRDPNQLAHHIVQMATGEMGSPEPSGTGKDPLAAELGRRGGLKGGKARAATMSPERRAEIARAAATARWKR